MTTVNKRLGELVIRTANKARLVRFYLEVIGLQPYATIGPADFLKISDGGEGHPQLLAIFDKEWDFSGPTQFDATKASPGEGTLHHFALVVSVEDFEQEQTRLRSQGIETATATHAMFGWRSLYLHDPDGNSVEYVCFDRSVLDEAEHRQLFPDSALLSHSNDS